MSTISGNSLNFDRGIDSISYATREAAPQNLPDRQNLAPATEGVRAQLAQLLDQPNTSDFLEQALRPLVDNRELLMPARFNAALSDALNALGQAAEAGTDDARVLNRAVRQLKEETGLRELVSMYRNALYQG